MRIEFIRSGGIAGVTLKASVDTGKLPPAQGAELERLVRAIDFGRLPRRPSGPGADRFQYDLTILDGKRRQAVSFNEGQLTAEVRPLVNRLVEMAKGS